MMRSKGYRRKNYVIDKPFQFRFVATFLILVVMALALFTAASAAYYWIRYLYGDNIFSEFIFIQKQVSVETEEGEIVTRSEMQAPVNRISFVLPPILINNVVIMVLIAVIGIFYSHRIAGPAYRIQRDIQRALQGEKGIKIRLRKNDKLKELADSVSTLIEELDKNR
jgi:methyl-accepting chemotaxis protein